jgi:hypothetical protein
MPIVVMTEIVGMEWRQKNVSTPWLWFCKCIGKKITSNKSNKSLVHWT